MFLKNKGFDKLLNHAQSSRDFLLDLIFPITCINCKQSKNYLCSKCKEKIIINKNFSCPNCKKLNKLGNYCSSCQTKYKLNGLWISSNYHDKILADLIKKFKYSFNKNLAPILCNVMISFLEQNNLQEKSKLFKNLENLIIVPVPLHKTRQRFRGFNQSEELAKLVAKVLNIKLNSNNLKRHRATKAQAKLSREQRLVNLKDAFVWTGKSLKNKNIILIDDVSSTGATLDNCAKALKSAETKNIWGLVLAKN